MAIYHRRNRKTARFSNSTKSQVVDLTKIVKELLAEYEGEVQDDVIDAFNEVAPKIETKLREKSKEVLGGSGFYARGWTLEALQDMLGNPVVIVYNKSEPTLTHLLENGHRGYPLKNGGRTPDVKGFPHIAPVKKWAEEAMYKEVKERIEQ